MKAIILAAGLGTRLRPLTLQIPKPMVPVAGVPNIERIVRHLRSQGISEFAINLHHCPEPLKAHLGDGGWLNVAIEWFHEPEILGTGGAIRNMIGAMGKETFIVVNGDVVFMPDIAPLLEAHRTSGAIASMIVKKAISDEAPGTVGLDTSRRVRRLLWAGDSTNEDLYMFTGMHLIEPRIAPYLPHSGCIVRQGYIPMLENADGIFGIPRQEYFCDLGTAADYLNANLKIATGDIPLPGFVPAGNGCIISPSATFGRGAAVENSIIGDNAHIGSDIRVSRSIVMPDAMVKENIHQQIVLADGTRMDGTQR